MTTVFEDLSELEAKREAAFESTVEALVEGLTVDAQTVDQVVRDAGRTSKDLASIVDKRKRLKAAQAEVARLDDLLAERTELQQQISGANAELDRRVAEHHRRRVSAEPAVREVGLCRRHRHPRADGCGDGPPPRRHGLPARAAGAEGGA